MSAYKSAVSVIIPCYNGGPFIRDALESVIRQDLNTENIVVDDGSTDNSSQVLRTYGDRITVLTQQNGGPASARNAGLSRVTGRYVYFLDADDVVPAGGLQHLLDAVAGSDTTVAYGGYELWDKGLRRKLGKQYPNFSSRDVARLLCSNNIAPVGTFLLPAGVFEQVGVFDISLGGCEDWDLLRRVHAAGFRARCTRNIVLKYRKHPETLSKKPLLMYRSGLKVIQAAHAGVAEGKQEPDLDTAQFLYAASWISLACVQNDMKSAQEISESIRIPRDPPMARFTRDLRMHLWNQIKDEKLNRNNLERLKIIYKRLYLVLNQLKLSRSQRGQLEKHFFAPPFSELLPITGPRKLFIYLRFLLSGKAAAREQRR
jgi:glycosyltransferase involved in cell wall biosynthesis